MRIVDARVITTCPGRNFVTLKILTDDGVYGIGDATLLRQAPSDQLHFGNLGGRG